MPSPASLPTVLARLASVPARLAATAAVAIGAAVFAPATAGAAETTRGDAARVDPARVADAPRVLRYAFPVAETGFDPAQVSDLYSATVIAHIFDSPLQYDFLARPAALRPATAAALPEVSPDGMAIRVRIRPGIFFADDPAFGGRPRELTAADYVYSIKRHYDPRWRSPSLGTFEE